MQKYNVQKFVMIASLMIIFSEAFAGSSYIAPSISYDSIKSKSTGIRYIGFTPGLALGYGSLFYDWLYLAAEVYGKIGSMNHDDETMGIGSLKPQYTLGISALPAIVLDSWLMAYVRLGAVSVRFKSFGKTPSGYQIGGGLEGVLCKPWTVRLEYVYTGLRSFSGVSSPRADEYRLAFVYRFL